MKRLLWPLLSCVLVAACARVQQPPVLEVTPERAAVVPRADARDSIVKVSGPSTLYVLQNGEVRVLIRLSRPGAAKVIVPLGAVDDGSADLVVGVMSGSLATFKGASEIGEDICSKCMRPDMHPCCPGYK